MRSEHTRFLVDPIDFSPLSLTSLQEDGEHVEVGFLANTSHWYPIIGGIPRLLIDELKERLLQEHRDVFKCYRSQLPEKIQSEWQQAIDSIPNLDTFLEHQKKTGESFAYEWEHIYRENNYEKDNFFHFAGPYITETNLAGKRTLDIGCGSGRFTKWAALSGTDVSFGSDLGESVKVAYALTRDIPNVCIVQADIYHMPFRNVFDLAYSIGVLHHLPNPKQGFLGLPIVLKSGGEMVIWVYNRRKNARALYFYEPLRTLLKKFPKPFLFKLSYIPGAIVHGINLFGHWMGEIGFPRLEERLPFSYYRHFPFNMKLNDAFDVLATPKSNYYLVEEIATWFEEATLKEFQAFEHPEAGITARGIYDGKI